MTDIEIPYKSQRGLAYRLFEILPGAITWSLLALPLVLSIINVTVACVFILAYLLVFFIRTIAVDIRALQGYRTMQAHKKLNWRAMLSELATGKVDPDAKRPKWHIDNVLRRQVHPSTVAPDRLIHAVIVATYNESREVLEPTIQTVLAADYDSRDIIFVLAYEERGGPEVAEQADALIKQYGGQFLHAMAVGHPQGIPGEIKGKGGNITYAGRALQRYLEAEHISPDRVIVTSLDADNRPDPQYFGALSYVYSVYPDPMHISVQPISVYTNNIWDAPAPMRVIATGNTFYNIVLALRPHMLRNFSAHAQSMSALIETDFWSVRTIVEDGHQFWRSYFRFDGNYRVLPLYVPIYQDAVLTDRYMKTLKAQFIQLRRWTYGASDIAYVAYKGFFVPNKVPRFNLLSKFMRLLEGHVTWAAAPLVSLLAGFMPSLVHHNSYAANELPIIVSRIQTAALIGLSASLFVCLKTLPPRPERYKSHRGIFILMQWAYLPLTTICYNSFAALYSQTRLMFGKYLDKFDVTEKTVVTSHGTTSSIDTGE